MRAGFAVTVVVRPENKTNVYSGVTVKTASYSDTKALAFAFEDQHAVVEAFNPAAASHQSAIVEAALAAGVLHLITPEFGSDSFNPHVDELLIYEPKREAQRQLADTLAKSDATLSWTAIHIGAWYDWAIEVGRFWVDKKTRTITRFGSGNQKYSMSRLAMTGDAVVAVLKQPELFRNKPVFFASHTVSTNQLIDIIKEELADQDWKVVDVALDGFAEKARELWDQDTKNGVQDRLNSRAYAMLGTAAIFDENNKYGADFGTKVEPGWDEGEATLRRQLKDLLS